MIMLSINKSFLVFVVSLSRLDRSSISFAHNNTFVAFCLSKLTDHDHSFNFSTQITKKSLFTDTLQLVNQHWKLVPKVSCTCDS